MSYRPSTGRKLNIPHRVISVRDLIRRHLREEGKRINPELAAAWNMHPNSAYRRMYDSRPFTPQMVDAVIELLKLDEFDANELRKRGALESGWNIAFDLVGCCE